jgi:hypothetical protein
VPPVPAIRLSEERTSSAKSSGAETRIAADRPAAERTTDAFKRNTLRKLKGVRCPRHRQPPLVHFEGTTLQTVSIRMTGCCDTLIALANQKIAGQ